MSAMLKVMGLAAAVFFAACGDPGMGSVTFRARFPENVTFERAPGAFRAQRFEDTIGITTVRLTAVRGGSVEATRDFAAADREGALVNLTEGVYEIRVEGLVGSEVVLRASKSGVVVETAKVRDAGEFFLAPVAPKSPVLTIAPAAVTTVAALRLEGRKEMFTGIRLNGADVAPPDDLSTFSLSHALVEGANAVKLTAFTAEGSESAALTLSVTLDRTPPQPVSFGIAGAPAAVSDATVTLLISATDAAEMMIAADAAFASGTWIPYETSVTLTLARLDGAQTLYVKFRDRAGNESAALSTSVVLDSTPPASPSIALVGAPAAVSTSAVTLALAATGSPWEMQISEDPAFGATAWEPYATTKAYFLTPGDGTKTLYARFRDVAGNLSAGASVSVELDTTAPSPGTLSANGGVSFTTTQSISVVLSATGAAEMQLGTSATFGGAVWQAYVTSTTFTLPAGQGAYTVYARFRDAVGNVSSTVASGSVTLDQSIPAVTVFDFTAVPNFTANQFEPITLIASDSSALEMRFDFSPAFTAATAWEAYSPTPSVDLGSAEGLITLYVEVRDAAGNVNQAGPIMVTLDYTAPSAPSAVSASPNPSTGNFALSWSPGFDATSGIMHYEIDESPDGFAWGPIGVTTASDFAVARSSGLYYYRVRALDNAGLASAYAAAVSAIVDTLPPVAGAVFDGAGADIQFQNDGFAVTANWSGFSDDSGITNYDIAVGTTPGGTDVVAFVPAGLTSSQTVGASLSDGQTVYVTVRAWDVAGNFVDATSDGVTVDLVPPAAPLPPSVSPNPTSTSVTVTWAGVTDAGSGVAYYELFENGSPMTTSVGTAHFIASIAQGNYAYAVRAYDVAGNASTLSGSSPSLVVDTTPPAAPWSMSVAPNPASGPVTATWFAGSDAETGVAGYIVELSPDGIVWAPYATTSGTSLGLSLGQGVHYVRAIAYDGVDLRSVPSDVAMVTIDQTPPSAGVVYDGPDFDAVYSNSLFAVTANWFAFSDDVTIATYEMAVGTVLYGNDVFDFIPVGAVTGATLGASLGDGVTYYTTIRALDAAGNAAYATSNGFIVDATPPPVPTAPSVSPNPTTGPIMISWAPVTDSVSGVAYYELLENGSPVPITTVAGTSFFIPAAPAGAYYYQVRAVDAAGNLSAESAGSPGVIVDQTAPSAPFSMGVAPNPSTGPVLAAWFAADDPETGIAGYIVEMSPDGFTWSPYTTTTSTSVEMTLGQGLHYVRAIAYNGANMQSAPSDVFMVTIDQIPPTTGVVNDGSASDIAFSNNGFDVTANWNGYSDNVTIAGYEMAVGTAPFGTDVISFMSVGMVTSATLSNGLSEGITLYTTIRAIDSAGNTADASSNGFVVDLSPPPTPATPTVSPNPTTGSVTVSWAPVTDAISGVAYYEVWENSAPVTTVAGTSLNIALPPEGNYIYEIRAFDAVGNASVLSPASANVIVDRTPPTAPAGLSVTPNPASAPVNVSWFAASDSVGSGVQGYIVETSPDDFTWTPVATTSGTSYVLGLPEGLNYVRVIAYDNVGLQGADSGSVSVMIDTTAPTPLSFGPSNGPLVNSTLTPLDLLAVDADEMHITEDPSFLTGSWQPYAVSNAFSLSCCDGVKTIYVRFRDQAGNVSASMSASVTLDTAIPPTPATPTVFPSPTTAGFTVAWTAVSDATGIQHYELWENGSPVTTVAGTGFALPNPPEGSYAYQVVAVDGAGNSSNPSLSSAPAVVDRSAPNAPAAPTFSGNPVSGPVTVSWSAVTDVGAAGVQDYLLEQSVNAGGTWSLAAVTAATSQLLNLAGGNYLFRVAARDFAGNVGAFSVNSVNLAVSVSGPVNPTVFIEGNPMFINTPTVKLLLSADGATGYEASEDPGFTAPQSGPMTTATNFSLSGGDGSKTIYVRYTNGVYFSSVVSRTVTLDTVAPTLSDVVVAGGATAVSTATVSLALTGAGAFQMTVTGDAVEPRAWWTPYQASSSVTLATRSGKLFATIGSASVARAAAQQPDGKLVVVGYATNTNEDWVVARYNLDGSFDPSFGGGAGKITVQPGALADYAYAVSLQGDKIIVGGAFNNGTKNVAILMRFNADGSVDNTFGPSANGKAFVSVAGSTNDGFTKLAIDASNRIIASGWTFNGTTGYDVLVARFDADGFTDTSFNGSGYVATDISSLNQQGSTLVVLPDTRIAVGGYHGNGTNNDFLVLAYDAAGGLSTAFGGTGYVITTMGSGNDNLAQLVLQPDGKLLAVGQAFDTQNRFAFARYVTTGTLDASFGAGTGKAVLSFGTNDALAGAIVLPDGKILAGGHVNGSDFFVGRFNADGSADNTFANGGWSGIDVAGNADAAAAFVPLADGTVVIAGQANNGVQNHWAIVRVDELSGKPFGGFGPIVEGVKTLFVRTRDQAGNLSSQLMRGVQFDKTPPTPTWFTVAGSPSEVSTTSITLTMSASEGGDMQISESPGFGGAPWIAYNTSAPFSLSPSEGTKTLYIRFRDAAGNVSNSLSTSVIYRSFGLTSLSVGTGFDGDVVTLYGYGFGATQGGSFVRFGPSSASVQSWSDTQISVWVPTAAGPGNQPVTLDKAGQLSNGLPFLVRPRIITVAPGSGSGGTGISLGGYNFGSSTATLTLGGMPVTTSGWSMMSINFTIPNDIAAGSQPIEVFAAGVSSDTQWVSIYPALVTMAPAVGQAGATVTLTGTNFGAVQGGNAVYIDGLPVTASTWSVNSIAFTLPPNVPAGTANVSVNVNAYPSNTLPLTVKPVVTSASPVTATGGVLVTVAGYAFGASKGGSQFLIGGAPTVEDAWSDTSLTWTVPASLPGGSYPIQVQVNGQTSDPAAFFVNPNVASLSAATVPVGAVVGILGTNFGATQTTSTVTIGGQNAAVQSWSSSSVQVWVPAALAPGNHAVIVNVGGRPSGGYMLNVTRGDRLAFMTAAQGPVPAGICSATEAVELRDAFGIAAPATAPVTVTLTAPSVRFYTDASCTTENANPVINPPDSSLTFYFAGTIAGSESMNASAPGLASANQTASIMAQPPTKLQITGPVNIAANLCAGYAVQAVDAYGNLSDVSTPEFVTLGGQGAGATFTDPGCGAFGNAVTIAAFSSSAQFWFRDAIPESLILTASGGTLTGASYGVNVTGGAPAGPVITSLSVAQGKPGTSLTIYGTGFGAVQGKGHVAIGGAPITALGMWSDTQISVTTWYAPSGTVPVVVWAGGKPSNEYPFENQQMAVLARSARFAAANESVTFYGNYFGAVSGTVSFDGTPATVLSWSDASVTARVPATGARGVTINDAALTHATGTFVDARGFDTWIAFDDVPEARAKHTAVWTGAEMLVWGGETATGAAPSRGGRYNPALDAWLPMNPAGTNHRGAAVVWTGGSLIVFGGTDGVTEVDSLQRYSPYLDTWDTLPADTGYARQNATAVWTGHEVIVWGGEAGGSKMAAGRRFDPWGNTWSGIAALNEPSARSNHAVVWTGGEMIVWGGADSLGNALGDGARYSNAADQWMALAVTGAPDARQYHTAVWTGAEMLVWGGYADVPPYERQDGARYNPQTNTWAAMPVDGNTPAGRDSHTAVWTGEEMIVFGGTDGGAPLNTGGALRITDATWTPLTLVNAPQGRIGHSAVFTGQDMIVWGGDCGASCQTSTGGRFNVVAKTWAPTALAPGMPSPRTQHQAVWTGAEMIVWGGYDGTYLNTGGRYIPATDTWMPTSTAGAPAGRTEFTMLWNGVAVDIQSGQGDATLLGDGFLYDPSIDSWTLKSATNSVGTRSRHAAVWTGTEAIFFGGWDGFSHFGDGKRYDPALDTWTTMGILNGPSNRSQHTAVWDGTRLVVWGGYNGSTYLNTGSRYYPAGNTWATMTTTNGPTGRIGHTAVWDGLDMIIYGGTNGTVLGDVFHYSPSLDSWLNMTPGTARQKHTAVWNGVNMLVFGGANSSGPLAALDKYDSEFSAWTPGSALNAPVARFDHTAVWTGTELLIWGGDNGRFLSSGGRY